MYHLNWRPVFQNFDLLWQGILLGLGLALLSLAIGCAFAGFRMFGNRAKVPPPVEAPVDIEEATPDLSWQDVDLVDLIGLLSIRPAEIAGLAEADTVRALARLALGDGGAEVLVWATA